VLEEIAAGLPLSAASFRTNQEREGGESESDSEDAA